MLNKEQTKRTTDLQIGDQVRKYMLFGKEIRKPSMEANWSETIYEVVKVQGQTVLLNDGTKYRRYHLLKIPDTD